MPDPLEAVGEHVEEEAADELVGAERHALLASAVAVILPGEGDGCVVEADEAAVGDGDPVRVAGEIGEHLGGPGERALGVDDPFGAARRREVAREG